MREKDDCCCSFDAVKDPTVVKSALRIERGPRCSVIVRCELAGKSCGVSTTSLWTCVLNLFCCPARVEVWECPNTPSFFFIREYCCCEGTLLHVEERRPVKIWRRARAQREEDICAVKDCQQLVRKIEGKKARDLLTRGVLTERYVKERKGWQRVIWFDKCCVCYCFWNSLSNREKPSFLLLFVAICELHCADWNRDRGILFLHKFSYWDLVD